MSLTQKRTKRLFAVLLVIAMVLTMIPSTAFAGEGGSTEIPYTIENQIGESFEVSTTEIAGYYFDGEICEMPVYVAKVSDSTKSLVITDSTKSIYQIADCNWGNGKTFDDGVAETKELKYYYPVNGGSSLNELYSADGTNSNILDGVVDYTNFKIAHFCMMPDGESDCAVILVQCGGGVGTGGDTIDKSELETAINDAETISNSAIDYIYNGNLAEFQMVITEANIIKDKESATQAEIDEAVKKLNAEIAKFIPKTQLENFRITINGAPNMQTDTSYYHNDDHYNGKVLSENGLWKDYQDALEDANSLFVDNDTEKELQDDVTSKEITKKCGVLKSAINNLIPSTQSNTTALFEAIQDLVIVNEGLYDREKWTIYNTKKQTADALLASLFNADGQATEANVVSKQADIDKVVAELSAAYRDLSIDISSQEQLITFMNEAKTHKLVGTLKDNISLTSYTSTNIFEGTLEGNGYSVTIDSTYKGLTSDNMGTIKNITICGDKLENPSGGGLIVATNNGTIENCNTNIDIDFRYNESRSVEFGCICKTNKGIISKCYNTGNFRTLSRNISGFGGICYKNQGEIKDCYNSGNITFNSSGRLFGGISGENITGGSIEYCYNTGILKRLEPWVEPMGYDYNVPSWLTSDISPIVGHNKGERGSVSNCYYMDTVVKLEKDNKVTVELSDIYLTKADTYERNFKKGYEGYTVTTPHIGTYVLPEDDTTFSEGEYYAYYDVTNDYFIAVKKSAGATSNVINAASPSTIKTKGKTYRGLQPGNGSSTEYGDGYIEKTFYLVEIPEDATNVVFTNTKEILDPTCGMNNLYGSFYDTASKNLKGTRYIDELNQETIRRAVKTRWPEIYSTMSTILQMPLGSKYKYSTDNPGDIQTDKIRVTFRLIGATKSISGNYDVGKGIIDSDYVNWISTTSYTMEKGDTVGELFKRVCRNEGFEYKGLSGNYISSMKSPASLGGCWMSEFTNGPKSGWMYTVNGKHPNVGLNSCYLKKGDRVIWHYINDYSYECSDWFDDPKYPNLGNKSTWDPWLKVKDEVGKSSTNSGKATTDILPTKVKGESVELEPKAVMSGTTATLTITSSEAQKAIDTLKKEKADILVIEPKINGHAEKVIIKLSKNVIDTLTKTDADVIVKSEVGEINIPNKTLENIVSVKGNTVTFTGEKDDKSKLSEENKKIVGDHPIYHLSIDVDGKSVSSFNCDITVKLPYTAKANTNTDKLTVYYIDDNGKATEMVGAHYDAKEKCLVFKTNHFSTFAVVYDESKIGFVDVKENDWFYKSVQFALKNNLFKGTSETKFGAKNDMTRAMLVTVIYRMEGSPAVTDASKFTDVKAGQWYEKPVVWADANKIVSGYSDTKFGTNDSITREQIAVILYRYAKLKGYDMNASVNFDSYTDKTLVSSYATDAMKWAIENNIISGRTATTLAPKGTATRAEVATMLMRFMENNDKIS